MSRRFNLRRWLDVIPLESRETPAVILWQGNGAGDPNAWSNDNNWVGGAKPQAADTAKFDANNVQVNVDVAQNVAGIQLTTNWSSTFNIANSLTTTGASAWSNGTISGVGTWNNSGTASINGNAVSLSTATWVNTGTINITTTANLNCGNSAVITNSASGVIDIQTDADVVYAFGGEQTINNAGIIRKTGGAADTVVIGIINNQGGTWDSQFATGTLHMQSDNGTHTGGTFKASAGAFLDVTSNSSANWKGTYTGSGTGIVYQANGTISIDAAGATFNFPTGLYQWNGGTVTGAGKLTNASTGFITLAGPGAATFNGSAFSNAGTVTHKTTNILQAGNSTAITNETTGIYDFQADGNIAFGFGGEQTIVNKGLFKKSVGAGVSQVQGIISNQGGTWEAQTGTLRIQGDGGTHTGGTFQASAGAFVDINGSATTNWKGSYTGSGAGVVYFNNGLVAVDATGATFNFPAGLFEWNGGTVTGGPLTNAGTMKFNGGTMVLNSGSIINNGTINHATGFGLQLNNSSQFQNGVTGVYDFQSDGSVVFAAGGAPTLTNSGLIRKTGGTMISNVDGAVSVATGVWQATAGQLALRSFGQTHTGGTFKATTPGLVNLTGGQPANWKGSYTSSGTGTVAMYDTTTIDAVGATFNFPSTTPFHWVAGAMSGGTFTNTGFVSIDGTVAVNGNIFINQGTVLHTTLNNLQINNSAQFQNTAAGVYNFQVDGSIQYVAGGVPTLTNAGLIRKTGGTGTSLADGAVSVPGGVWESLTGTLALRSFGQTHTGGLFKATAPGLVNLTGASAANWKGSYTSSGTGTIYFNDSTIIDAAGATFNFPSTTPVHWGSGGISGGTLTNTGFIVLDFSTVAVNGSTLINEGTFIHTTSGNLQINNSAQFQNKASGVYEMQNDGGINYVAGGIPTLTNAGLIRKTGGVGTSIADGAVSVTGGVWEATSGQLWMRSFGQTHTGGTFKATAPGVVNLTGGVAANWKGTFISTGTGTVGIYDSTTMDAAGATFNFPASTPLHWSAGQVSGGTMTNQGFMVIDSAAVAVSNTTLVNDGTITHTTANNLQLNSSAQLQITATGYYDFQSDASIQYAAGGPPTTTNSGLIRKSGGSGTSSIVISGNYVSNGGLIDVQTGTIQLPTTYTTNKGGLLGKGTLQNSVNNNDGFVRPGPISGTLTVNGNYTQGSPALFVPEMKGTTVADFTQMQVNGTVTLDGILRPQVAYTATVGDSFTVLLNDGGDAINGTFANAAEGGSVVAGGTTFSVTYKGGDGNDIVLKVTNVVPGLLTPPKVLFVAPNGGGAQRSRVTSLLVQFDQPIVQAGTTAAAFQLNRQSPAGSVTLGGFDPNYFNGLFGKFGISPINLDFATLTFIGGPVDFGSLADGRYTLTIDATQISSANGQLDGNGNGTGGDNYTLVGTPANGLFRQFGDANGDGTVAANDFIQFRLAFGGTSNIFDFDGDGAVAASDFIQFRLRFGGSV